MDHDELASNRLELDQSGHQSFEMMTHDGREQTGDIGHDGMMDEEAQRERERRRRAKGKAKVSNATSHDRDLDEEESSSDRFNFPPESGDEDAREAKRIADVRSHQSSVSRWNENTDPLSIQLDDSRT